jgi:pimeloyl-ACP methyl ester carboxylesterase
VTTTDVRTGHAPVGDLKMYFEVHGTGRPLVLLHGAYMTVDMMGPLLDGLAAARQVVVPELRGHGRTGDADGPITYEGLADDVAGLVRHLELGEVDVVGYSMGAAAALQLGVRHPELVRRLVVISGAFRSDAAHQEAIDMFPSITPEMFAGSPMEEAYLRLAPEPGRFPELVEKLKTLDTTDFAWPEEDIRAIGAPTQVIVGDSDVVRLEHAVELFRLRGGGVMGDLAGLPEAQLAVLPGTSHFMPPGFGILDRPDRLLDAVLPFLDPPEPQPGPPEPEPEQG